MYGVGSQCHASQAPQGMEAPARALVYDCAACACTPFFSVSSLLLQPRLICAAFAKHACLRVWSARWRVSRLALKLDAIWLFGVWQVTDSQVNQLAQKLLRYGLLLRALCLNVFAWQLCVHRSGS